MEILTPELWTEIVLYLSPSQIVPNGSLVCSKFNEILHCQYVWKIYFLRLFPVRGLNAAFMYHKAFQKYLRIYFKCFYCKRGTSIERRKDEIVLPCRCKNYVHSECLVVKNQIKCSKCNIYYQYRFRFSISSFLSILQYAIVLFGSQAMFGMLPYAIGQRNMRIGYKRIGYVTICIYLVYSIWNAYTVKNVLYTCSVSWYLHKCNTNGMVGFLSIFSLQSQFWLRTKRLLDQRLNRFIFYIDNWSENNDKFLL